MQQQQQLLEGTINIVPETMDSVLAQILTILSQDSIRQKTFTNIIKALFYGLWNFDKMINQHYLSTAIAQLPHKLSKEHRKTGTRFYEGLFEHLEEKWTLIDHHRINKFMQLVRYLIRESLNFALKNKLKNPIEQTNKILKSTVFSAEKMRSRNGIIYHITDIYFGIVTEFCVENNIEFSFRQLGLYEYLLLNHQVQHFRHHLIDKVYGSYKDLILQTQQMEEEGQDQEDPQEGDNMYSGQLKEAVQHFLQLAKNEDKDTNRKNIYLLVGYLKSQENDFTTYCQQKQRKALLEKEKQAKKKLTKGKLREVAEFKEKRKEKKKNKSFSKNKKIISKRTISGGGGRNKKQQKFIEDF